ncbi:MAG TPA: LysM peptidoglycan-binding domain-containing protein [Pseudonocardiaceae bacterium]|nr:LysM peptidoglycan-binding domain-containing protein [Pseudonocardiaceae bacterium]
MSLIAKAREQVQKKVNPPNPTPPMPERGPAARRPATRPVKATLTDNKVPVVFQFNPELIRIGHQPDTKPMNRTMGTKEKKPETVVSGNPNEVIMSAGEASISFSDIMFDGPNVIRDCAQLLRWTYPIKNPKNPAADQMVMPILYFSWSKFESGLTFLDPQGRSALVLAKVDVSYVRFDSQGTVTRAKVNLSCKIPPSTLKGTNPTSGGRPDRTGHLVTAGEDLPGIARANYGSPGHWRQLAQANGIDDPLRLRPGHRLFVPGRVELPGGST